jgi:hypothetical protein
MTTFTTEDRLHAGEYPLTEEQIKEIHDRVAHEMPDLWAAGSVSHPFYVEFARAIERTHGIFE